VKSFLFNIFGHGYDACCGEDVLHRFRNDPHGFCLHPFSSYEVVHGFDEIVDTCNNIFYKLSNGTRILESSETNDHRLVILTSLQDPVEAMLADVHQACNNSGESESRDDRVVKAACKACSFDQDKEYWMSHPTRTVDDYAELLRQATGTLKEFDHYWVDVVDLNNMFYDIQTALYPRYEEDFYAYFKKKHAPETLGGCELSMHAKMIKALRSSRVFYRKFTQGIIDV
jgi:acetone carboxylase gamma subunit